MLSQIENELNRGKEFLVACNGAPENLYEVERALAKEHEGTYGFCDWCGDKIDWATLKASPQTTLCFKCQSLLGVHVNDNLRNRQ